MLSVYEIETPNLAAYCRAFAITVWNAATVGC